MLMRRGRRIVERAKQRLRQPEEAFVRKLRETHPCAFRVRQRS